MITTNVATKTLANSSVVFRLIVTRIYSVKEAGIMEKAVLVPENAIPKSIHIEAIKSNSLIFLLLVPMARTSVNKAETAIPIP